MIDSTSRIPSTQTSVGLSYNSSQIYGLNLNTLTEERVQVLKKQINISHSILFLSPRHIQFKISTFFPFLFDQYGRCVFR